jgi:protein TonB
MKQDHAFAINSHYHLSNSDMLLMALFAAAVVHVIVLLGIDFAKPERPKLNRSIEITLSHTSLKNAPKQAKYLAPDHQLGAGERTVQHETPKDNLSTPQKESVSQAQKMQHETTAEPKPLAQKVVSQTKAPVKIVTAPEPPQQPVEVAEERPKLAAEALQQQIAQLGERIRTSQQSSEDSKIKTVNSISTHKFLAAQYVKDWEDKVERTGNMNYPEAARLAGASQSLTMEVGIEADGSIYSMHIVRSSGNSALDEAAKRIVKMSAPFAELPYDLLHEVKVLVITRVWKFSDETGMTAR